MPKLPMRRPSASMILALIALFAALGGGAYAAATINGKDIRNGTIAGKKLKNGAVTVKKVKNGTLTGKKVKNDSLTGKQIKESSLGTVPKANDANTVGGQAASGFEPAQKWILVQGAAGGATVLAQSGGLSATRLGLGVYSIDAGGSVSSRPLLATVNPVGGAGIAHAAPCGGSANNPGGFNCPGLNDTNHVLAVTLSAAGAAADRTFYLTIGG